LSTKRVNGAVSLRTCNLLPVFWTALSWKIPVLQHGQERGAEHEEVEIFGAADRLCVEAGRGRGGDCGGLSQGGDFRSDVYNWRKKYAGLLPSMMKQLRQLEDGNGKLKKLVANLSLDREMLQDVIRRKL
jgi:hypothetical protein